MIVPAKYISELFRVSAEQMGLPYIKTPVERLESWSIDNNNPTFMALVDINQDIETSNTQANSIELDLTLVCAVETMKIQPEDNYTIDEVEYWQNECDEIIYRFAEFVRRNEAVESMTYNISEVFKDPDYLGIGKGIEMSITISDMYYNCLDFRNIQTVSTSYTQKQPITKITPQ